MELHPPLHFSVVVIEKGAFGSAFFSHELHFTFVYTVKYQNFFYKTNCFVVSQLFSVARHAGRFELGSQPTLLYARLSIVSLSHLGNLTRCLSFIPFKSFLKGINSLLLWSQWKVRTTAFSRFIGRYRRKKFEFKSRWLSRLELHLCREVIHSQRMI